jgi:hypothetical protein
MAASALGEASISNMSCSAAIRTSDRRFNFGPT